MNGLEKKRVGQDGAEQVGFVGVPLSALLAAQDLAPLAASSLPVTAEIGAPESEMVETAMGLSVV